MITYEYHKAPSYMQYLVRNLGCILTGTQHPIFVGDIVFLWGRGLMFLKSRRPIVTGSSLYILPPVKCV